MTYRSTKVIDGFSTCFRQHSAEDTHCKFLHGYAISFKVTFEGELDSRNWVVDFGGLKRSKTTIDGLAPKNWFNHMFDHTTIIAHNDPHRLEFEHLAEKKVIQLRKLPFVGCEKFAEFVYYKLRSWCLSEFNGRVKIVSVECREHEKNTAIYG